MLRRRAAVFLCLASLSCDAPRPEPAVKTPPLRGVVEVIAGETSRGIADGVGVAARFNGPAGLGVAGGRALVADTFSSSLRAVDLATAEVTTLVRSPATGEPRGVTGSGDVVFFADGPCVRRLDADGTLVTLAGDCGTSGYQDATGADARFSFLLHDLEVLADDTGAPRALLLSDRLNDAIRVLDLGTLAVLTLAGGDGPGNADGIGALAQFDGPGGLALDTSVAPPVLYVADTFNDLLRAVDTATGAVTTVCTATGPQGVALVDGLLVSGGFDGSVTGCVLATGATVTLATGLGGTFASPTEIPGAAAVLWMDLDGPLLRIDVANPTAERDRVSHVAGPRAPTGFRDGAGLDARFRLPVAVEVDGTGEDARAFIADGDNHAIRIVALADGATTTLVGGPPGGASGDVDGPLADARLSFVGGLAFDADARVLYVADVDNQKIKAIDLDSQTVRTLAGSGAFGGDDGPAELAQFADPWGLALADSALFVADSTGATIRRVSLATGDVTTIAGRFGENGATNGDGPSARFRVPAGLAATADALWLCDAEAHTIRRIDLVTGAVSTVAGSDGFEGAGDGPADFALFSVPVGIAARGDALLIVEQGGSLLRELTIDADNRTVRTLLGQPGRAGGLPTGVPVPLADATLLEPQDIAVAGDDLVLVADGAVWRVRP